jgi:hypothetical protein
MVMLDKKLYKIKSCNKTSNNNLIQRAMNAYQIVKDYQDAWQKHGSKDRVELYTSVTNEKEAQEWLDEFSKNIE